MSELVDQEATPKSSDASDPGLRRRPQAPWYRRIVTGAFWGAIAHRLFLLSAPIVLSGLAFLIVTVADSIGYAYALLGVGLVSLFGFGTTVIFLPAIVPPDWLPIPESWLQSVNLSAWEIAFVVMWVNALSAWWYVYNIDLLERLPKIGPFLRRSRKNAVRTLAQRPWIRRFAAVGVGAFVITPLPGSGSLGGAIMGRIVGVSRFATTLSVSLAGIVVSVGYAYAATSLGKKLNQDEVPIWMRVAGLVLVLVLVWFMIKLLRKFGTMEEPEVAETTADLDDGLPHN